MRAPRRLSGVCLAFLLSVIWLLLLPDNPRVQAQMFGPRRVGGTLRRQAAPGLSGDVGMLRNQRFIRGNRQRTDFVGTDRGEAREFVGVQQSGSATAVRSAVSGIADSDRSTQINQPLRRASRQRPYDPRLEIGFDYLPQPAQDVATEVNLRLSSLTAGIEVSVADRTAILRGVVASEADRQLAELLASFEPGVSSVRNELAIAGDKEAVPPRINPQD